MKWTALIAVVFLILLLIETALKSSDELRLVLRLIAAGMWMVNAGIMIVLWRRPW